MCRHLLLLLLAVLAARLALSCSHITLLQAVSCRPAVSCKPRWPRELWQRRKSEFKCSTELTKHTAASAGESSEQSKCSVAALPVVAGEQEVDLLQAALQDASCKQQQQQRRQAQQ
jgi:hypothetical protein